jgi:hypothetical protein
MYNKNNYFLYHRSDTDKFEFISYDTDNTFGVDWVNRDWATRNCLDWYTHSQPRPLASKILSVPEFMEKYERYLDTIARSIINPNIIFSHIDTLKNLITEAAIADTYRTLDYGYTVADFHNGYTSTIDDHTPYGIKPFLTKRYTTMLQQLGTSSVPEISENEIAVKLFPNPVDDILTISVKPAGYNRHCQVIDMNGRKVKSFIIQRKTDELSVVTGDLKPGVYSLVIKTTDSKITRKFVKK